MASPDELQNKKNASPEDEDDFEYELEPPDPDVITAEQRRLKEVVAQSQQAIDIDAVYRDAEHSHSSAVLEDWARNFQFRFQVKHLLVATAVLAVLLTIGRWMSLGAILSISVMLAVIGVYLYVQWIDQKHDADVIRRRHAMYEQRRAAQQCGGVVVGEDEKAPRPQSVQVPTPNRVDEIWRDADREQYLRFHFSLKQLLTVMVLAAVMMGLVRVLGGPQYAASLLGLVAISGLFVHTLGYEPPGIVALGWWVLLAMYCMLSILGIFWTSFQ